MPSTLNPIFTPNVVITRNYESMLKFTSGRSLQDIKSKDLEDTLMFVGEQNKYIYGLEHNHNFGQSDLLITLKILDVDGNFESSIFSDNFLTKTISTKLEKFFADNLPAKDFNNYMQTYAHGNIRVYISYGIGDDLSNWADPKCCTLVEASIDVASNGVRNYVYKFQPLPNAFFSLIPEKDNSDPNSNDIFNIPFASMEMSEDIFVATPNEVSKNLKDVMTGFAAKAVSTPKGNVIICIPDIDKLYLELVNEDQTRNPLGTVLFGDLTGDYYAKIFKSVSFNYTPTNIPTQQSRLSNPDISIEKETEDRRDYEEFASKRLKKDLEKIKELQKRIQQIRSQINYINDILNNPNNQLSISEKIEKNSLLFNLNTELENLQFRVESFEGKGKEPYSKKLVMRSSIDKNNKDPQGRSVLDTRQSIIEVFDGINMFFEGSVPPSMSFETNIKWLKVFKKFNLIENEEIPCLIIGDRGLILHYLYGGRFIQEADDIGYKFNELDNLNITEKDEYKNFVLSVFGKNKIGSSFGESLFLDDLSLGNEDTRKALSEIERKSQIKGKPIFINNFRNSNVLSFSLKNSENYGTVINQTVRDNRLKYLYSQLNDDQKNKLLLSAGLDPEKIEKFKNSNPLISAKEIYEKALEDLRNLKIDSESKLTSEDIVTTELIVSKDGNAREQAQKIFDRNEIFRQVSKIFGFYDKEKALNEFAYNKTNELMKGLVINQSSKEEISLVELRIRYLINQTYKLETADLSLISKLIILFNRTDNEANTGLLLTPGLYTPGESSILARAYEYSKRLAVEISIKTLPFFYLSNFDTMSKKCVFLSKRNSVIGTTPVDTFDFFSGEYMITGFRHVISTSECYSEFLLNKFGTSDDGPKPRRYDTAANAEYKIRYNK
jgi:hypothetical protein